MMLEQCNTAVFENHMVLPFGKAIAASLLELVYALPCQTRNVLKQSMLFTELLPVTCVTATKAKQEQEAKLLPKHASENQPCLIFCFCFALNHQPDHAESPHDPEREYMLIFQRKMATTRNNMVRSVNQMLTFIKQPKLVRST
jgi:hypothetical protein